MKTAYFSLGCFWSPQLEFEKIKGVKKAEVGYCGGNDPNTTYEKVCSGSTNHAETIKVEFDENEISYEELVHEPINPHSIFLGQLFFSSVFVISLIGVPFFSGYFSKDLILETLFLRDSELSSYAFLTGLLAVLFTTLYSLRLIIYVFHRKSMANEKVVAHIHESPFIMTFPLIVLSIFAIFFGMFSNSYFIGSDYLSIWSEIIFVDKSFNENFIYENMPIFYKKLPLIIIIFGMIISYLIYFSFNNFIPVIKNRLSIVHNFFKNKWYIDEIYQKTFVFVAFYLGKGFWKSVDRDLIDNLGPNGMSKFVSSIGLIVSKMQSGYLYHYVLSIIIGLTLLISLYTYIF